VPNPLSLQLVLRQQAVRVQHRLVRHAACDTNGKGSDGMGSIPLASCWLFTVALGLELRLRASLLESLI